MPKTKSRTAIWFFANECMRNDKLKSRNIKEAIEEIYPEWKAMATFEKAPYERMCEVWRNELKAQMNILPNFQPKYNALEFEKPDKSKNQEDLSKFLNYLANMKREDTGKSLDGIKDQHWYFIKFQTFCKSDVNPDKDYDYDPYFVLAEVALIEYSLREGIINEYNSFIKPNKIPLGYTSQCMDCSKEEHQIPLYGFNQVKKTYSEIYKDIERFLKKKKENNFEVLLFCMEKYIDATNFGLKFLYNNTPISNDGFPFTKIYDLENLVVNLGKHCNVDYSLESARDLLTSYTFDYTPNSRCDFHEDLGTNYCSLGLVKKYSFLISDNICQSYDINLTSHHIPVQKPVGTVVYNDGYKSSRVSSYKNSTTSLNTYSSNSSAMRYNNQEDDAESINSVISSRNMPSTDVRRRQLVSDKLEKLACISTVTSSVDTKSNSKYEQYVQETGNFFETGSFISDSIDCDSESRQNQFQNAQELLEEDEEGWEIITKKDKTKPREDDGETLCSDRASNFTNKSSINNSSTRSSYMGRGRGLVRKNYK